MQTIVISGALGKDAELRQTGSGDVCSFSVAVSQGFGERKRTNWFRCNIWGKRGASLAPHLRKGIKVVCSGELEVREYEGKTQLEIRVNEVDLMSQAQRQEPAAQPSRLTPQDDWGSDSVPF